MLLKSSRAEPCFAPAFVAALARREPALAAALAAATWPGGAAVAEAPLLAAAERVVAYGDAATLADLERRTPGRVLGYGPKTSLAVLGAAADPGRAAAGLARDVALFDQRGCLSVAAVYTAGDATALADLLAAHLAERAELWPPGPAGPGETAAVRHQRDLADLQGLHRPPLAPAAGTVVVDPDPTFRPSPGRRFVRVHPLADPRRLPALLAPWHGRLQGAAVAGFPPAAEHALRTALGALGLSRFALPGELQTPDARWHNGGLDPLVTLS